MTCLKKQKKSTVYGSKRESARFLYTVGSVKEEEATNT